MPSKLLIARNAIPQNVPNVHSTSSLTQSINTVTLVHPDSQAVWFALIPKPVKLVNPTLSYRMDNANLVHRSYQAAKPVSPPIL